MTTTKDALKVWLVGVAVLAGAFLIWAVREPLLLAFIALTLAVLLSAAAETLQRYLGLARKWSLLAVGVLILVVVAGLWLLIGSQIETQVSEFVRRLPQALRSMEDRLGLQFWERDGSGNGLFGYRMQEIVQQVFSIGRTAFSLVAGLIVVIFGAAFLAVNPTTYVHGVIALFPTSQHERINKALADTGRALRLWLKAELISMSIVGVLVGLGAWLIGLPAPLALGLLAGLTEFIPIVGPIIGAVPGLLLAVPEGTNTLLWTIALFIAIQQIESNVITPVVQREMVEIPPALLLFALLVISSVFGLLGTIVAAPLTVVLYVLVKELYVRETLGITTTVPGESR